MSCCLGTQDGVKLSVVSPAIVENWKRFVPGHTLKLLIWEVNLI